MINCITFILVANDCIINDCSINGIIDNYLQRMKFYDNLLRIRYKYIYVVYVHCIVTQSKKLATINKTDKY